MTHERWFGDAELTEMPRRERCRRRLARTDGPTEDAEYGKTRSGTRSTRPIQLLPTGTNAGALRVREPAVVDSRPVR
jgi:hypothetical protein